MPQSNTCKRWRGTGKEVVPEAVTTMTLAQIRDATGLSWAMVSRVFSDDPKQRRSPSLKNAKKIADCMGISLDLLYDTLGE